MKKVTLIVILITIVSKVFGFAREVVLSYFFGASSISDAYLIAITIPGVLFGFIAAALSAGYIPLYSKIEHEEGSKQALLFTNNLINITIVLSTIFVLLGVVFTRQIIYVLAPGFDAETATLAISFTRLTMVTIYFSGLITIMSGYLHVKGSFIAVALIGIPMNVIVIASFYLGQVLSLNALAIGYVIAIFSQLILVVWVSFKTKFKYSLTIDFKNPHMVSLLAIVIPIIIGVSVNQINVVVDRSIASSLEVGAISALNYAQKLNSFVQGVFILPLSTILYPAISTLAAQNNIKEFKDMIIKTIVALIIFLVPSTIGILGLTTPIVTVLFGRGAFDELATSLTSSALWFYAFGLISFGLSDILVRAFYSQQDTKTPVVVGIFGVGLNVVLNIILSRILGVGGLALATSITATMITIALFVLLRRKIGPFQLRYLGITFLKVLVASLIMVLVTVVLYNLLYDFVGISRALIASIAVGALLYLSLLLVLRIPDVNELVKLMLGKLKSNKQST